MSDSWCIIICLLLLNDDHHFQSIIRHQHVERMIHSHYQKTSHKELDIIGRRLWQGKIPRCCLHDPSLSDKIGPWAYDTTNTLVWFPPSEYRSKKELGEKPDSIQLLESG